jgi:hypothetical protein
MLAVSASHLANKATALQHPRLRIEPVHSRAKRYRLVKDGSGCGRQRASVIW